MGAKLSAEDNQGAILTLFPDPQKPEERTELEPKIWRAAQHLTSPDDRIRDQGLSALVELNAHRHSPLVAYLLATRITDPNLRLRFRIVQALGNILRVRDEEDPTPAQVRVHLQGFISQMRKRQIFSLLQVADQFSGGEEDVAAVLNLCSYAGDVLSEIIGDRKAPLSIRQQAIYFSGQVGFLDAIPALERLIHRLQAADDKQTHMEFVRSSEMEGEGDLLTYAQAALEKLSLRGTGEG